MPTCLLIQRETNIGCIYIVPINLPFTQTSHDVYDFLSRALLRDVPGVPPFDLQRSVDGERGIEILKRIPVSSEGLDLEVHPRIVGVYDKASNMVMETEQTLLDARTGDVYARLSSKAFGIGQGGYGGSPGPKSVGRALPDRAPDAVHVFRTTAETALLYRLCGDYNPIHADDGFAREGGFKEAFLQGLCTWNVAAHGVLREMGGSRAERLKSFKARFAKIVWPGDVLETRMWKVGERVEGERGVESVVFETVVGGDGDGRVVLSGGFVELWKGDAAGLGSKL